MLRFLQGVAVLLCVFILLPESVLSIECYQCNSEYDPRCGDPFDAYSLETFNCSLEPPPEQVYDLEPVLCRKIVHRVYGQVRVVRSCGYITDPERDDKECGKGSGSHNVFNRYCSCTENLCNGGKGILIPGNSFAILATLFVSMAAVPYLNFQL